MQRTPPQTRSQVPAQHPLDPNLEHQRRHLPSDLCSSLEPHGSNSQLPANSLPTQQAISPSNSDHSAGHEGRATSPAQDEDPTQLFLKLLQTIKQPSSSGPKFCTPGMKPPDKFNSENSSKLRGFLQSCKLLFSNDPTV
ncbi:hypothetical protein VP01_14879g1, partial [Puccinia sorghi]